MLRNNFPRKFISKNYLLTGKIFGSDLFLLIPRCKGGLRRGFGSVSGSRLFTVNSGILFEGIVPPLFLSITKIEALLEYPWRAFEEHKKAFSIFLLTIKTLKHFHHFKSGKSSFYF